MRVEESRPLLVSASDSAPINIGEGDGPSDQARRVGRRLTSIDLLRGAIVIIMAWDHSKDFLASYKGNDETGPHHGGLFGVHSESFAGPLELYRGQPAYQFARFISHFCAPGFSLLMGVGMVLLSESRRQRAGWTSGHLLYFFILRGIVLIALGFAVRGALMIELINPNPKIKELAGRPAAAHLIRGVFQVMTSLGMQMIGTALVLEILHTIERLCGLERLRIPLGGSWAYLRFSFQPAALFLLGVVCTVVSNIVVHRAQHGDPSTTVTAVAESFSELLNRFLLLPGPFYDEHSRMIYPLLPWLGVCLFGAAMGFEFKTNSEMAHKRALVNGTILLCLFPIIRFFGGAILNYRGLPIGEGKDYPWNSFWAVCKYPPSLGYLSITLGADLVALYLFSLADATRQWAQIVLHYGRSPLAFYITHWYILTTIALIIYSATNWAGVPLAAVIPFYMLVIFLEYFLVVWYDDFKQGKGPNSLWRLL